MKQHRFAEKHERETTKDQIKVGDEQIGARKSNKQTNRVCRHVFLPDLQQRFDIAGINKFEAIITLCWQFKRKSCSTAMGINNQDRYIHRGTREEKAGIET